MNLSTRSTGVWQHTLDIEVPREEVESRLDEVARQIQRRASLPGFRKGRVPLELVRQHYAEAVEQEFLENFVPKLTSEAIDQARLDPVVPPLVRNLRFGPGQPMRFEAVVDVRPEVEAKDYRGLRVKRTTRPVDEAAVERVLAELREESAIYLDIDRPAGRGDVVLLDSIRLDANGRRLPGTRAKNRRVPLGTPEVPPDLENALLGAQAGQERTFDLTYPPDHPAPELAGRTVRYLVNVRKIQEKKLRELDDNFARDVFHLESLEELRSRVRLNLEGEERVRAQRELESALTDALLAKNPLELPGRLVAWTLDRVIREAVEGRTVPEALNKELQERYRPGVERSLHRELLLAAVARQEQLAVSDEDVAAEIDRMAQADPRQAARVRARYQSSEPRAALRESLRERKAMDWLVQAADIEEPATESPLVVPAR
ncbi:MAG TPA: trigger factor [Candidatus Eisenbacteria bacterium]|nr:trigger factor [Candidatus Eisenbacteria bacterium]